MKQPKIGFIGYGRHAKTNLYPSIKLLDQPIQAIATTSETAKQGQIEQFAKSSYSDYNEMFKKESLDAVFISAKPEQHMQIVKDSLNAGVHVFVEKNLGWNAQEAQEIADLSDKTGKFVQIGFMKRYAPA